MTFTSIFQGLAANSSAKTGIARELSIRHKNDDRVLLYADFEHDRGGSRIQHMGGAQPYLPTSVTEYPGMGKSLALPAHRPAGAATGYYGLSNSTYFNRSRDLVKGDLTYSAFMAFDGTSWDAIGSMMLYLDTQSWDDSTRSFARLRLDRNGTTGAMKWMIAGDRYDVDMSYEAIPGATFGIGDNDNKANLGYVEFTVGLSDTGAITGYKTFQFGGKVFDLTGLDAGTATHPPQVSGSHTPGTQDTSFAGGLNPGAGISMGAATGRCCMYLADMCVTINDPSTGQES